MNIVDNASSSLLNSLFIKFKIRENVTLTYYGTYQHATKNVTLAQSKSYNFAANGLGGVLYYSNATIRGYYDGMKGISAHVAYIP